MIAIREGGLDTPAVQALLALHARGMLANSPAESCHFLDLSGLKAPDVRFWSAWDDAAAGTDGPDNAADGPALAGVGALRRIDARHGEIKSMRTAPTHLRRGVAAALLAHIMAEAADMGIARLSLETGDGPGFAAAHALYRRFGFEPCPAFGDYRADDRFSRFFTRRIGPDTAPLSPAAALV